MLMVKQPQGEGPMLHLVVARTPSGNGGPVVVATLCRRNLTVGPQALQDWDLNQITSDRVCFQCLHLMARPSAAPPAAPAPPGRPA